MPWLAQGEPEKHGAILGLAHRNTRKKPALFRSPQPDGAAPLQLAGAFEVAKTTMTHTLAGLERHGFAEMRPNPDDKQSKQVWLTPAGRQFRDDALTKMAPLFGALNEQFSARRVAAMLPDLGEFREVIDRLRNEMK